MAIARKSVFRQLDWPIWLLAAAVILSLVGFGAYYYYDRYVHADQTVMERQASQVESMVKQNPQNPDIRVGAADFYLKQGLVDLAIQQANEALKIKADYVGAFLVLGRAYKQKGDMATALNNYNRFFELEKASPLAGIDTNLEAAYYEVGMIYFGQNKYAEATDALQAAIKIDGTDADALYELGMVYQAQKDHASAIKQFEQALRFDPMYGPPYQALAVSYAAIDKPHDAAYAQAMVTLTQGKYAEAAAQLESVAKQSPDLMKAYFGLGVAYDKLGKLEQARAALQKYVQANPDDVAGQSELDIVNKELNK